MNEDPQADAVIDRLLKERREALASLQEAIPPPEEALKEIKMPARIRHQLEEEPAVMKEIKRSGKLSRDYLSEEIGKKLREAL